ncbi:hypothetical protein GCM10017653_44080 [Ancylobacter defluvii]|uniref:Uncharacterized protein n=1 Tax=Ancylobacter defluvii TaxID=1282440 RepID=A0A9W6NCZ4_9HYPH|nr:hypothetical protein GCM10017653_44080 [Ancylobacter defluvii]
MWPGRDGVIGSGMELVGSRCYLGADKSHSTLYMGGFALGNESVRLGSGVMPKTFKAFVR